MSWFKTEKGAALLKYKNNLLDLRIVTVQLKK
jgi:hypothetical protein